MFCERCNADFPEGLKYCKWCGGALADQPRITSELHSCPSCAAAVQPSWAFCKSCGERLNAAAREPSSGGRPAALASDSVGTAVIAMCSGCGERLETGSLYCKACGSATSAPPEPLGASTLLCGKCKSYSPVGSLVCRMCGAPFPEAPRTVMERAVTLPAVPDKPKTLPDLDDHLASSGTGPASQPATPFDSGSSTMVFTGAERDAFGGSSRPTGGVETNLLAGTAGARSEQQAPTSIMQMGRITGPVEGPSGELPHTQPPLDVEGATVISVAPPIAGEPSGQLEAPPVKQTTLGLGTESTDSTVVSENKTQVFVSPSMQPAVEEKPSQDEVGTRPFEPPPLRSEQVATRAFESPPTLDKPGQTKASGPITGAPQWTTPAQVEPVPASDFSQAESTSAVEIPAQQKRSGLVASVVVAVVILVAGGFAAWWFLFARSKPVPRPAPPVVVEQPPVTEPAPPPKPAAPVVPEGMVAVATGAYTIGRDDADSLLKPRHKVDLPAFFIDRTEVTNAAYKKFVDLTNRKPPSNWIDGTYPEGRGDSPVTGVTWRDAADYAAWAGKRLPTEAEWEATARGADARLYPWGNDYRTGVANIGLKPEKLNADQYPTALKDVGRYPEGASPFGAVDLIGNAWEWVADEIKVYPGNTESKLELDSGVTYRVIRGGAYDGGEKNDATYRGYLDGGQVYPKVGFRCAKDAK